MLWLEWRRWCCGLGEEGGVVAWVEKVVLWLGWRRWCCGLSGEGGVVA